MLPRFRRVHPPGRVSPAAFSRFLSRFFRKVAGRVIPGNAADAENVVKYPKFAGGGKIYDYICEPLEGIPLLVSLREEERLGGRAAGAKGGLMTN